MLIIKIRDGEKDHITGLIVTLFLVVYHIWHRSEKIMILIDLRKDNKKIPMSVATMSRLTKRAYLMLCPE